jgi:Rho GTPase-activating protein 1
VRAVRRRHLLTRAASNLTQLALYIPIENLLIPPSTYLTDRRISDDIFAPYASGRRAFAARNPFPHTSRGTTRFPRVLRETTSFILLQENITSEGLFRIPAHSKLREVLKEAYDRGQKYIVWKDNGATLPVPAYPEAEYQDEIIAEVDPRDAYSVFMAAALIKAWYAPSRSLSSSSCETCSPPAPSGRSCPPFRERLWSGICCRFCTR